MKGLKKIGLISSFYKVSILIFTIIVLLAVFAGCDMLAPKAGVKKIDVADASIPKAIAVAEDTAAIDKEAAATEETMKEQEPVEREMKIKAYYSDEMAESVVDEPRSITGTTNDDFIFEAFKQIIKDPSGPDLYDLMPQGTRIIGSEYIEGIAVINLSSEFVDNKGSEIADTLVPACIVNTLTEIEGKRLSVYGPHDLSVPIRRNYSLIKGN